MRTDPLNLPPLRQVVEEYGLQPRKAYGQNFLFDSNITDKIAGAAAPLQGRTVIEVGPGPGGLTRSLLRGKPEKVVAFEYDPRCVKALESLASLCPALSVDEKDALQVDFSKVGTAPRKIVANLPYNISTVLLGNWLEHIEDFESLTLMFQKEVAERLVAAPRTSSYGRLSVITQWCCDVEVLFDLPPSVFYPPPKVTSSVVQLIPRLRTEEDKKLFTVLEHLTKITFGKRRKMLRSSLKGTVNNIEDFLAGTGVLPTMRPEELSVADFVMLAKKFSSLP